jgi:lipopolysaccharide cholinephosphotransferase
MAFSDDKNICEIQHIILEIFKEFKRICNEYNLRYYAIGGTCIGAVRHKGFIPWDDDLDVVMPFEDYSKFRKLVTEIRPPYELYDPARIRHAHMFYLKLHNSNTSSIAKSVLPYKDGYVGIFMDIMPLYGFPESHSEQEKCIMKYLSLYKLNRVQRFPFNPQGSVKSKIRWLINYPIKLIRPYDFYSVQIEKLLSYYPFGATSKIAIGGPMNRNHMIFDYIDFENYIEVPFEDTVMRVATGYDNFLHKRFGDYMVFPPKEDQIPIHSDGIVDVDKSYRSYI